MLNNQLNITYNYLALLIKQNQFDRIYLNTNKTFVLFALNHISKCSINDLRMVN